MGPARAAARLDMLPVPARKRVDLFDDERVGKAKGGKEVRAKYVVVLLSLLFVGVMVGAYFALQALGRSRGLLMIGALWGK